MCPCGWPPPHQLHSSVLPLMWITHWLGHLISSSQPAPWALPSFPPCPTLETSIFQSAWKARGSELSLINSPSPFLFLCTLASFLHLWVPSPPIAALLTHFPQICLPPSSNLCPYPSIFQSSKQTPSLNLFLHLPVIKQISPPDLSLFLQIIQLLFCLLVSVSGGLPSPVSLYELYESQHLTLSLAAPLQSQAGLQLRGQLTAKKREGR